MKAWILSLCLFALILGMILGNSVYVHRTTAHICEELQMLSMGDPQTAERLDRLNAYWLHHKPYMALSIGYRDIDRLYESLLCLRVAYDENNSFDFELYRRLSADTAEDLSRLEQFSVENLF